VVRGRAVTALRWTLLGATSGARLELRPFLAGRDYHSLHHENPVFGFNPLRVNQWLCFAPYPGIPQLRFLANASFSEMPCWYRNFLYTREQDRGLDSTEDLAAPGLFVFDLSSEDAFLVMASSLSGLEMEQESAPELFRKLEDEERRRRAGVASRPIRRAETFLARRDEGTTIVAGYPWFTDWGRDTFISLRGLCLSTGREDLALEILLSWSGEVRGGMLPNFFPDGDRSVEYNTVDASLWFIVAVHALIQRMKRLAKPLERDAEERLWKAVEEILSGYSEGTRYGIALDPKDGLLRAGEPGVQLTWMDAKVGDWVVTPRIGKPVEVQALWLNALEIAGERSKRWRPLLEQGRRSFAERFWNEERGCLFDVVDVDHVPGTTDPSIRPNQLFAVGGLPFALLTGERAAKIVDCVERELLTPRGLRSLAPGEPGYTGRYAGGPRERDAAYHQGTAWAWLLGPFIEAWLRVRPAGDDAKQEAQRRFLAPLEGLIQGEAGLGYPSEISDGDPPFTPRGCPFQAWSLAELIRIKVDLIG